MPDHLVAPTSLVHHSRRSMRIAPVVLGLLAAALDATPSVAEESDATRYFFGRLGDRRIVLTLEFRQQALKESPNSFYQYNIFGEYFYLDEDRAVPKYLQGRWRPEAKLLALEEYRQAFHRNRMKASDSYTERKEQTGFFAGEMTDMPAWASDIASKYQVRGTWIQTDRLLHHDFYLGGDHHAKTRAEFELREGGSHLIQMVSGKFTCGAAALLSTRSFDIDMDKGNVSGMSWAGERCSVNGADLTQNRGALGTVLTGVFGSQKAECVVKVLNLDTHLFVAAGPWMCPCKGVLLVDKASGKCHDLWPQ